MGILESANMAYLGGKLKSEKVAYGNSRECEHGLSRW